MDRDKAAPLIGRDLPEFERAPPAVRTDCAWADAGIVDEDVDAPEPTAGGFGDLPGCGIVGQIGLDGEQLVRLAPLTGTRGERFQRVTVAIDPGDPDVRRQQAPHHGPADPACCAGYDGHSVGLGHVVVLQLSEGVFPHRGRMPGLSEAGHLRERNAVEKGLPPQR